MQNNAFTNNGIHASFTQDTAGNLRFSFLNNGTAAAPMTGNPAGHNVFSSSQSTGGTLVGTISGNFVGSTAGGAISAVLQGQTDATLLIDGNNVQGTMEIRGRSASPSVDRLPRSPLGFPPTAPLAT